MEYWTETGLGISFLKIKSQSELYQKETVNEENCDAKIFK